MKTTCHPIAPPPLAPPGAGLPPLEAWLVRLFGRPLLRRRYTRQAALADVERTAERLLDKTASLSPDQLATPKLIPRLRGLEDSSRFWSPSMVLEHLCITGRGTVRMAILLSNGQCPERTVSTATVKPQGRDPGEVREEFATMHRHLRRELEASAGPDWNGLTHDHPWFGPLTASDWLRMMAMHMQLHEKQLDLVLKA
ncbi:MAG: DinB family protein [Chthoniobacter sp.]|uniref:DinB family protein n=1 Tax=Chthoniobacter sp. TaxID=2510640 RepID=UPI0032A98C3D